MDTNERFREIYKRYVPLLRIVARKGGIPYDEIEDAVQETFTAYYSHYPLTWPNYKVKAMLTRIMKNRCVDYLRRKERIQMVSYDPVTMRHDMIITSELCERDNLSILLEKLEYQDVMEALKSMREDWRTVFELHVIEGRPMDEVSRILKISEAACRQRLCRGRKYLRQYMIQMEESRQPKKPAGQESLKDLPNSGGLPGNACP